MAARPYSALVLEDEPLIAMDLETLLEAEGFVVTSIMSCVCAHAWLDLHRPDVVIVDIELRDGPCTAVATRLLQMNIPFVVHSGCNRAFHAGGPFAKGVWLTKPALHGDVLAAARAVLAEPALVH